MIPERQHALRPEVHPMSYAQERLWLLNRLWPDSTAYNIHVCVELGPDVTPGMARAALRDLAASQDCLRTSFDFMGGEPCQVIWPEVELPLSVVTIGGTQAVQQLAALSARECQTVFDLRTAPLFRTVFVQGDTGRPSLSLTMHHIISDGWSMDLIVGHLGAALSARERIVPPPFRYADYAALQRAEHSAAALAVWKADLEGAPGVVRLPVGGADPDAGTWDGGYIGHKLDRTALQAAKRLAASLQTSLFSVLFASFSAFVHRLSLIDDMVIGVPDANRDDPRTHEIVGFFVNTLPVRVAIDGTACFADAVARARDRMRELLARPKLPFEKLVADLAPGRTDTQSPFFNLMYVHQTALADTASGAAWDEDAAPRGLQSTSAKFDLTLFSQEVGADLLLAFEFRRRFIDEASAAWLLSLFAGFLAEAVAAPRTALDDIPLGDTARNLAAQKRAWGRVRATVDGQDVASVFRATAAAQPDAVALRWPGGAMTYRALCGQSDAGAAALRGLGVVAGDRVAMVADRRADTIVAMLAVLKAGAAYVPLNRAEPKGRLARQIEDAEPRLVLADDPEIVAGIPIATLFAAGAAAAVPHAAPAGAGNRIAYVMYTSGSTGVPKGAVIRQSSVVSLVRDQWYLDPSRDRVILHYAPLSFDAATFEIWGALLNGGTLALPPPGQLSFGEIAGVMREAGVTTAWLTSSLFCEMVDAGVLAALPTVRHLLTGGEPVSHRHIARAMAQMPGVAVTNGYGPTETTTFALCHRMTVPPAGPVPIGRAIDGVRLSIVDAAGRPVPAGVPGELVIGGAGVGLGYWRLPDLTEAAFRPDPEAPGA
uniref:non-ribosomal peptide synthetase n=1 Tax=Sphingomonas sp. TaxID=28214 RepID=UPI002DD68021